VRGGRSLDLLPGLLVRQVDLDRGLVEGGGLAPHDGDGVLGALAEAGAQPVAIGVADQARLAVDDRDHPLGAGHHAVTAAVAPRLVDLDDLPMRHR
jgi:hypothetical protein